MPSRTSGRPIVPGPAAAKRKSAVAARRAPPATAWPVSAATRGLPSRKRSKKRASNTREKRPKSSGEACASVLRSNPPQKILGEREVRTTPRTDGSSWASSAAWCSVAANSVDRAFALPRESARIRMPPRSSTRRSLGASTVTALTAFELMPAIFSRGRSSHTAVFSHSRPAGEKHRDHPEVLRQFGMERRRRDVGLAHEYRVAVPPGEHLHGLVDGGDPRGADEDGFERIAAKGRSKIGQPHDSRIELPSVSVPDDGHREEAEARRPRALHVPGEENRSRTGAKDGIAADRERADRILDPR